MQPRFYFLLVIFPVLLNISVHAQGKDGVRPGIARLAGKLSHEGMVHVGNPVGFSARPETNNKYYKMFRKLKKRAGNAELDSLANGAKACIIVYAFTILRERNYPQLKDFFLKHVNDSTEYWTASGCTGVLNHVNLFMLSRMKPGPGGERTNYLTVEEYSEYLARFKSQYPAYFR